jgi:hypothetical protein
MIPFRIASVQKCPVCGGINHHATNIVVRYCPHCQQNQGHICDHDDDGTKDCPRCGVTVSDFAQAQQKQNQAI